MSEPSGERLQRIGDMIGKSLAEIQANTRLVPQLDEKLDALNQRLDVLDERMEVLSESLRSGRRRGWLNR